MDFLHSKKMYHDNFRNYNFLFFWRVFFSLKNQTDNDEAGSRIAVTVVGLEHRMFVGRIKRGFVLVFG